MQRLLALSTALALILPAAASVDAGSRPAAHPSGLRPDVLRGHPQINLAKQTASGSAVHFSCQDIPLDTPPPNDGRCYQPFQIQAAYGVAPLLKAGITGKGRTIVIVDAYDNPYIETDLALFDAEFSLPAPAFQKVYPDGATPFDFTDPEQIGWSGEIALDVQWAHAMAPAAKIVLVLAASSDDADILSATKYAVDHNLGDVISQSFGEAESCVDPKIDAQQHQVFQKATQKGITLFASSGDDGAAQLNCDFTDYIKSASSPANDPLVTAVGGTNLVADATTGAYGSERSWADQYTCYPVDSFGCSGGGFSNLFGRPSFQFGVDNTRPGHRGVPDVAFNGGVDGGVLTHWGVGLQAILGLDPTLPAFFAFGGTSAGSPQWAGLTALADQLGHHRLGDINDSLYRIAGRSALYKAAFHDIKTGNNNFQVTSTETIPGFSAKTRWDAVTGLGSPNAAVLLPLLAASH
ncbi:MAG: S53 family peptidase [Candidatus Limnocylindrales bacterium]